MKYGERDNVDMEIPNSDDAGGSGDDITKYNDSGTYNVEATDADISDAEFNAADDPDTDNDDSSSNAKYGVINDIHDNDDGTATNNPDIDDPDDTEVHNEPLFCLVWYSVALLN